MSTGYYRLGGNVPGKVIKTFADLGPQHQITEAELRADEPPESPTLVPSPSAMGFTGNECTHCGSTRMLQTGHCETCQDCGETSACS